MFRGQAHTNNEAVRHCYESLAVGFSALRAVSPYQLRGCEMLLRKKKHWNDPLNMFATSFGRTIYNRGYSEAVGRTVAAAQIDCSAMNFV